MPRVALPVVFTNIIEQTQHWWVKYAGGPLVTDDASEYTVSAVGPQTGGPVGCTTGAMILTHGGTQSLVRSTLPCLDTPTGCSSPSFQPGLTPQPNPVRYLGNTCKVGYSTVLDAIHPNPEFQVSQTDAETIRIGPNSFFHLATGLHNQYVGSGTSCQLNQKQTRSPPNTPSGLYVDYYRRSDDCGATWPQIGSFPDFHLLQWTDSHIPAWNFDMPHLYVDPFNKSASGNYYAYIVGSVGWVVKGVAESGDLGNTWAQRGYIGDNALDSWGKNDGWSVGGNMTSTSDGTQFFAGCYYKKVRLFYSYDRWATYSMQELTWNGASPGCDVLDNSDWPAGAQQLNLGPYAVAISRLARTNELSNYARVRVAFPWVTGAGVPKRQGYRVLEVGVKRKGVAGSVTPYQTQLAEFGDSQTSIVEAGFVEPDPFDTPRGGNDGLELPDTALFWTMEGNHSTPSMQLRYRMWQGARTYSVTRDLSANNWVYSSTPERKWNGDYNRSGAYFYDKAAKRYSFLLVWPQGDKVAPTLSTRVEPHYNLVTVQPSINPTTLNVEKLNFGTLASGPGVASQGSSQLDVFWRDSVGNLIQKSYTAAGWGAGTISRGQPAGGFTGDPAVASWGSNRLDVFVRGNDNKLYQWWWDGTPRGWVTIDNGPIASSPAVTDAGNGILFVFARTSSGNIQYRKYTNATGWIAGWKSIGTPPGGFAIGDPVAVNDGSVVHLFTNAGNNQIYQKWSADGGVTWNGWTALGGNMQSSPAVASWGNGRFDLFAELNGGVETTLMHRGFEGGWREDWQDLLTNRGPLLNWIGNPDAVSFASMRVDVFARSIDNVLWHVWHVSP